MDECDMLLENDQNLTKLRNYIQVTPIAQVLGLTATIGSTVQRMHLLNNIFSQRQVSEAEILKLMKSKDTNEIMNFAFYAANTANLFIDDKMLDISKIPVTLSEKNKELCEICGASSTPKELCLKPNSVEIDETSKQQILCYQAKEDTNVQKALIEKILHVLDLRITKNCTNKDDQNIPINALVFSKKAYRAKELYDQFFNYNNDVEDKSKSGLVYKPFDVDPIPGATSSENIQCEYSHTPNFAGKGFELQIFFLSSDQTEAPRKKFLMDKFENNFACDDKIKINIAFMSEEFARGNDFNNSLFVFKDFEPSNKLSSEISIQIDGRIKRRFSHAKMCKPVNKNCDGVMFFFMFEATQDATELISVVNEITVYNAIIDELGKNSLGTLLYLIFYDKENNKDEIEKFLVNLFKTGYWKSRELAQSIFNLFEMTIPPANRNETSLQNIHLNSEQSDILKSLLSFMSA